MNRLSNRIHQEIRAKVIPRSAALLLLLGGASVGVYAGADQLYAGIDALLVQPAPITLLHQSAQDAGEPALILLNTQALVLTSDGSSTTVIARVRDDVGQPVAGASIDFFQTTGGFTIPESTVTNDDGEASVTFMAGSEPGQAVITARIVGPDQSELIQREVIRIVKPQSDVANQTLSLNFSASALEPGQQVPVTAVLSDGDGQPLPGELVSFFGSLGEVSPASGISDASGQVVVQYRAGTVGGSAKITALSGVASASASFKINGADVVAPTATPTKEPSNQPTATPIVDPSNPPTAMPTSPAATPVPDGSGNSGGTQDTFLPIIQ